jgi:hypothetical protein
VPPGVGLDDDGSFPNFGLIMPGPGDEPEAASTIRGPPRGAGLSFGCIVVHRFDSSRQLLRPQKFTMATKYQVD